MDSLASEPLRKLRLVVDNTHRLSNIGLDPSELVSFFIAQQLPASGVVLELSSNSGERGVAISRFLPRLQWQPSALAGCVSAIQTWYDTHHASNVLPPLILDVAQAFWPIKQVDAVFSADLVQNLGWLHMRRMLEGVALALKQTGVAIFYGRFVDIYCPSSEAENADNSIKPLQSFLLAARRQQLRLLKDIVMPANNRILVFQKG